MTDLNKVVDLCAPGDPRRPERSPVDSGARANLYIIFNDHSPRLIDFIPCSVLLLRIPETVGAYDPVILKYASPPDYDSFPDDHTGMEQAPGADARVIVYGASFPDLNLISDGDILSDYAVGPDGYALPQGGALGDYGGRVNRRSLCGGLMENLDRLCEGKIRILVPHEGTPEGRTILAHDNSRRLRPPGRGQIFRIGQEADITFLAASRVETPVISISPSPSSLPESSPAISVNLIHQPLIRESYFLRT